MAKCLFVFLVILLVDQSLSYKLWDLEFGPSEVKAFKKGGGAEFETEQHSSHGENGAKGHSGYHEQEKGAKGHHDKERQQKAFAEQGGSKRGHHHNDGYYAAGHKGAKGQHGYHYEDHGRYAKGHNTKGRHNVHKLDEYKKNTDFYDEDHDERSDEKYGGYALKKAVAKGDFHKNGFLNNAFNKAIFGALEKFDKGSHSFEDSGHKKAAGRDSHFENEAQFGKFGESEDYKKWGFKKAEKDK